MGLDMYLYAKKYVPGWPRRTDEEQTEYRQLVASFGMTDYVADDSPSATVKFTVAYWRKANAIHGWFVREVQDGEDECRPHDVSLADLRKLRSICQDVLLTKERYGEKMGAERGMVLLPPVQGFFFGVYDINEWYWEDLENTVKQLDRVLAIPIPQNDNWQWSFVYQSSW